MMYASSGVPAGGEVAVAAEGSEFEDGFAAGQSPTGSGDVHAVFDQVAAGAFDDAGSDRPAGLADAVEHPAETVVPRPAALTLDAVSDADAEALLAVLTGEEAG